MKRLVSLFATIMALVAVACGGDDVDKPAPKPGPVEPTDPSAPFVVDITATTRGSVTFSVTPSDPTIDYIYVVWEKEEVDEYRKDEYLVADIFTKLEAVAQKEGKLLGEYLPDVMLYGDTENIKVTGLSMDTDHYVVVFGVEYTIDGYVASTELVKQEFKTPDVVMSDATFDVSTRVVYNNVTFTVLPSDKEILYYICTMPKSYYNTYVGEADGQMSQGEFYRDYFQKDINSMLQAGYTGEQVIMALIHDGDLEIGAKGLNANTEYVYLLSGLTMDEDGIVITTDIFYGEYTTGNPEPVEMYFDIQIVDVQQMSVAYRITPSKKDQTYCALVQPWDGVSTKEEVSQQILDQWEPGGWMSTMATSKGTIDCSAKPKKLPAAGMDYYIIAFGYAGGVTTDVYMETFRTPEGGSIEDVQFDVKASNITPYGFTFSITPSDPTIYYLASACLKDEYDEAKFIKEDNAAFDYYLTKSQEFNSLYTVAETLDQYYYNDIQVLNASGLQPNTEYMVYIHALDIKTGHVAKCFTFDAVARTTTVGTVNPTIKLVGYYSGDDEAGSIFGVSDVTAGKAIAVVTYENFEDAAELYSFIIKGEGNDFSDLSKFPDATMWQLTSGFEWGLCPLNAPYSFYVIDWASECFALAYAVDKDGMTGRMARMSLLATADNKGDIKDLRKLYESLPKEEETRGVVAPSLVVVE